MENIKYDKYKTWLLSSNSECRDIAVNVFYHSGFADDDIDNLLISLLKTEEDKNVRRTVIHMFSDRADKKFTQSLFDALQDGDYAVRGNAYLGLIKLGIDANHALLVQYRNKVSHTFEQFCIKESSIE